MSFLALALIVNRESLPPLISVLVSNALLLAGYGLYYLGICRFVEARPRYMVLAIILLTTYLPFVLWYDDPSHLADRIVATSVANVMIFTMTAWTCASRQRPVSSARNLLSSVLMVFALINMVRIISTKTSMITEPFLFSGTNMALFYYATALILVMMVVGFSSMVSEHLREQLNDQMIALKTAHGELERLSMTDALTGLANRRCFDQYLDSESRRLRRTSQPMSILMIDVDCFKAYNDTYGHQMGDECLSLVGEIIRDSLKRPQDMAARYGGEEFCCILPETEAPAAIALATTIKDKVAATQFPHESSHVAEYVTISIGAATGIPDQETGIRQTVQQADQYLYWAKKNGRNRVGFSEAAAI